MSTVAALLVVASAALALAQPASQGKADARTDVRTLTGVVSCEWQVVGRCECRRRALQDCVRECVSVGSAYVLLVDKKWKF